MPMLRQPLLPLLPLLFMLLMPASAGAQDSQEPREPREARDTVTESAVRTSAAIPPSPTGALLRSMALPGWGQAYSDAWVRAGIYFAGHSANVFMVTKTRLKLGDAREMERLRVAEVRDSLIAGGMPADSVPIVVEQDEELGSIRNLISARRQQQEDWVVWTSFWILASAIDAFVGAHLADFPGDVRVQSLAAPTRGIMVGVALPLGGR